MPATAVEQRRLQTLVLAVSEDDALQRWAAALRRAYVVRGVTERRALEQALASVKPDVLVLDLALPDLRPAVSLQDVQSLSTATKIIVLTESPNETEGILMLKSGAKGYCASTLASEELLKAVMTVQRGEIWASRKLVRALLAELVRLTESRMRSGVPSRANPRLARLTERQRLVAVMISRGASNKEIGIRLNISERTVKAHLTEAFRHAGVSDRLQLALLLQGCSFAPGDD